MTDEKNECPAEIYVNGVYLGSGKYAWQAESRTIRITAEEYEATLQGVWLKNRNTLPDRNGEPWVFTRSNDE